MRIGGFQKISLIDFPGKIASVIFTQGCNFRCPFCHNPHLIDREKKGVIDLDDILEYLIRRKKMIDGVVVSGGEPLIQEDIADAIEKIKNQDLFIKLDTNGSNPERLNFLLSHKLIDYVAMDIKSELSDYAIYSASKDYTSEIKMSIELIMSSGISYEFRTTIVPGLHNKKKIVNICRLIEGAETYVLQNLSGFGTLDPSLSKRRPFTPEKVEEYINAASPLVKKCIGR